MDKYITNDFLKITNPQLQKNAFFNFNASVDEFDFEKNVPTQFNNYTNIEKILNPLLIFFTEINIVKWKPQCSKSSRCKFIIKTTNPNLLWYKSESNALGSGNNQIYYKGQKIKTTEFLSWNEDKFIQLLLN